MTDRTLRALLVGAAVPLLLAGCAGAASPPAGASAASATAEPTPAGKPSYLPGSAPAADPAAVVRSTVTAGDPRLVPSYVPAGMTAAVRATAASYEVTYTDDQHTRGITLAVNQGVNPPPVPSGGANTDRSFRGVRASYAVYDVSAPLSLRHLYWQEPGSWSSKVFSNPGIEYFLSGTGLTEAEFFRVASSLQPVG